MTKPKIFTIEDMQKLAESHKGKCLSTKYTNNHTKLKWQCKEGHIWKTTPKTIKRGHWCPECYGNAKLTLEKMQKIAKQRGGKCLSNQYINADTKLRWQCKERHIWEATPYSIKSRSSWCPVCAGNSKLNIEDMKKLATNHRGKCLSHEYINSKTQLEWQCDKGHIWEATPDSVKRGHWCPICAITIRANKQKSTIEQMRELATKRGGKCLSQEYINTNTKLEWKCSKGHTWWARPSDVVQNKWCPVCGGSQKSTIKEMQKVAKQRGGMCLSHKYVNSKTRLRWQCKKGHIWEATPGKIKNGQWCPYCAGHMKLTIEDMQKLAKEKGGLCLSTDYINARKKLKWQCKEGHIWEATPDSVKSGHWCPKCSENISERICRKIFENIFNEKFPKRKPKWLTTPQEKRMELDGYCKKLRIAFEYQGVQHYKYVPIFHETRSFNKQKKWDELKRKKCELNKIILIEVPYTIDYEKMPEFILHECKKRKVKIPEITKSLNYKLMNIYSPEKLREMQVIAKEKGGLCLSHNYINSQTKLQWQCKEGHIWEATPGGIKQGKWCRKCALKKVIDNKRLKIKDIQELAIDRGGLCLSDEYINNRTKLKWQCKEGHIWEASVDNIKAGKWCPDCGGRKRLTIEEMQDIAKQRNGECLSKVYINNQAKLKWQCKEGHIWEAIPSNIKKGHWCPVCAGMRRLTIDDMQKIAKQRGGICLSEFYTNAKTKLKWQCKEGHVWEATPDSIKQGRWCPICSRRK
jgi:hypothetical protein